MIYLILFLAFILRLPFLNGSFWLDEAAQALESSRPFSQQLQIVDDFQPPLLHYITYFSIHLGQPLGLDRNEAWLRFWGAVLPGLTTIAITYLLGKKLFNKKIAFLASLLLATSSYHIFFSQELRPYSLPVPFALLSILSLLSLNKNKKAYLFFALWSILGLYSSYLYPFFLLAQLIYIFYAWQKKQIKLEKKVIFSPILILLAYLPWLPTFFAQLQAGQLLRQKLTGWEDVVGSSQIKSLLLVPLKFLFGVSDLSFNVYYLVTFLLLGGCLTFLFLKKFRQPNFKFLLWFFLAPLLISWLVSFFVPVLQPKRVLYLLPFFYLILAYLVSSNKSKIAKLTIFILFFINSFSLISYWTNPKLQRENWRALIGEINYKFPVSKSVALFAFEGPFAPWSYYQKEDFDTLSTGNYDLRQIADPKEYFKGITDYNYVLVFDYLRDLSDPENQLPSIVKDFGYSEIGVLDYPNIGFVRIYINKENLNLASNL